MKVETGAASQDSSPYRSFVSRLQYTLKLLTLSSRRALRAEVKGKWASKTTRVHAPPNSSLVVCFSTTTTYTHNGLFPFEISNDLIAAAIVFWLNVLTASLSSFFVSCSFLLSLFFLFSSFFLSSSTSSSSSFYDFKRNKATSLSSRINFVKNNLAILITQETLQTLVWGKRF